MNRSEPVLVKLRATDWRKPDTASIHKQPRQSLPSPSKHPEDRIDFSFSPCYTILAIWLCQQEEVVLCPRTRWIQD